MQQVVDRLYSKSALWQNNAQSVSKFALLQAREQWRNSNTNSSRDRVSADISAILQVIITFLAVLIDLYHQ